MDDVSGGGNDHMVAVTKVQFISSEFHAHVHPFIYSFVHGIFTSTQYVAGAVLSTETRARN